MTRKTPPRSGCTAAWATPRCLAQPWSNRVVKPCGQTVGSNRAVKPWPTLVRPWGQTLTNTGQTLGSNRVVEIAAELWPNRGQTVAKRWPNGGQTVVKRWSNRGQTVVYQRAKRRSGGPAGRAARACWPTLIRGRCLVKPCGQTVRSNRAVKPCGQAVRSNGAVKPCGQAVWSNRAVKP